ncbi:MAG: SDR family oxidoreductase [Ignavibacteria bacterium]|nr:SDR family oxidoreductase [Ignavibacteria bacterium]
MPRIKENIWLTGASSGIGKSTAILFSNSGYNVFATARREEKLSELLNEIKEGSFIHQYSLDVCLKEEVFSFVEKNLAVSGIDCLINNAGITSFRGVEHISVEDIEKIIETNLLGAIYTIKAVLPLMIKQNRGTIINILSVVTEKVFTRSSAYSASKAGLKAFTQVLREEVRKYNIRVINVYPATTNTDIWSDDVRSKYAERMMKASDVAESLLSIYKQTGNIVTEEIVLKPILGDL